MCGKRYPDEFKIEAVKQVTDRGHSAADDAQRLGISKHSLYQWIKRFGVPEAKRAKARSQQMEFGGGSPNAGADSGLTSLPRRAARFPARRSRG